MISEPGETVVVVAGGVVVVAAGGVVEASFSFSAPSVVVTVDAAGGLCCHRGRVAQFG